MFCLFTNLSSPTLVPISGQAVMLQLENCQELKKMGYHLIMQADQTWLGLGRSCHLGFVLSDCRRLSMVGLARNRCRCTTRSFWRALISTLKRPAMDPKTVPLCEMLKAAAAPLKAGRANR